MSDCRPVGSPAEAEGLTASAEDGPGPDATEYISLVGSLLYAAMVTRPDIAFAVQRLSRKLQAPTAGDWVAGKRVLRYLAGTAALGLVYRGDAGDAAHMLVGYSDADWARDLETRCSTT